MKAAALLVAVALAAFGALAAGSCVPPPLVCPYADTAQTDGCAGAPQPSAFTVQHSDFFTSYALNSGQSYTGAAFTGSISGGVLTVSGASGTVIAGQDTILGAGVPPGVHVSTFGTGTGGNGTYNLANAGGLAAKGAMNGLRRPPWNVAGVDYPVGIAAYPDCTRYACTANGLKAPTNANFTLDGIYSAANGCRDTAYSGSQATFCGGAPAADVVFDGYDFCSAGGRWFIIHDGFAGRKVTIRNSYSCAAAQTFAQGNLFQISSGAAVSLVNDYFDGLGSTWLSNNAALYKGILAATLISVPGALTAQNSDCGGVPGASICLDYSYVANAPRWLSITVPKGCAGGCNGWVYQHTYGEGGSFPYTQFTGFVDDGSGAQTAAGSCLTVTSYAGGFGAVAPTQGTVLTSQHALSSPKMYIGSPIGCNAAYPTSSFTLSSGGANSPTQLVPSETMYGETGVHGDTTFLYFADSLGVLPVVKYSYNVALMPGQDYGVTGLPTFSRNTPAGVTTLGNLDHNVSVANKSMPALQKYPGTAGAVFGDDAAMAWGALNVASNYVDASGAVQCFYLGDSGPTPVLTGNANLLGNGSGGPDANINVNLPQTVSQVCHH